MQVHFDPDEPHLLRFLAETDADIDTIGVLYTSGPLQSARWLGDCPGIPGLVTGLVWDTRGYAFIGREITTKELALRKTGRQLAGALSELLGLSLREVQDDGVVERLASAPDAEKETAAGLVEIQVVKDASAPGSVGGSDGRDQAVVCAHGTPSNDKEPAIMSQTRASASRRRPPALIGGRLPGERFDLPGHPIYCGYTSSGELGGHYWYRMREPRCAWSNPARWRICSDICGEDVYLDAVVDDFGNLVAVPQ